MKKNKQGLPTTPRLADVRAVVAASAPAGEGADWRPALLAAAAGGKMLRARLILRLGRAAGVAPEWRVAAAAAVEMIHGATLLHDDVLDGGRLRRGRPTFWARHGAAGAILAGDYLLAAAMGLLRERCGARVLGRLAAAAAEVCLAEMEQTLQAAPAASRAEWIDRARRKTGALFAYAGWLAAGGKPPLAAALEEAGYRAGAAYQMADDILDRHGNEARAGKTLGTDARLRRPAAALLVRETPAAAAREVWAQLDSAAAPLARHPAAAAAWADYVRADLRPVIRAQLGAAAPGEKSACRRSPPLSGAKKKI